MMESILEGYVVLSAIITIVVVAWGSARAQRPFGN
ncbi:hypothetical protein DFR50_10938 [Roseiarcus fermentans]|uniref:Uncharacterized protein n=1 Tax=Roseiarcus fermentans TaxID=1473586 RepID=A0A366FKP3_9HYPH|nr:hypothetical protein DFR50_10938 [Roseiarcus fermentans]